jgi:hypothetical protein
LNVQIKAVLGTVLLEFFQENPAHFEVAVLTFASWSSHVKSDLPVG